jgi:hypothetical protein
MTLADQHQMLSGLAGVVAQKAETAMGAPCLYDHAAVVWLEDQIRDARKQIQSLAEDEQPLAVVAHGAVLAPFFGECLVRTYAGQWAFVFDQDTWAVSLRPRLEAPIFPQQTVHAQLRGEEGETALALFERIAREHGRVEKPTPWAVLRKVGSFLF